MGVADRVGLPGAGAARPTCWAAGRWRSSTTTPRSASYFERAARVAPEHPVLIDSFLEDAFEADVDAISDGTRCVIGGVMQHIEDAGIHSGDSACVLPPYLITEAQVEEMRRHTRAFAERLGVVGLHQRAVRHQGRRRLRARGEPARLAHGAVRLQDHRRAAREPGRRASWWARRSTTWGFTDDVLHPVRRGEGSGVPLQQARRAWISCSGPRCAPPAR